MTNALDRMAGGADDNSAQANHLVPAAARCLTTSNHRIDGETETFVVADTLTSGSHPHSNMPGRRREDDTNIVTSTTLASDPISAEDLAQPSTKRNGDPGCISYAAGVRRLTPVETERLQGFPDGWTAVDGEATPDSRRYAAMGDAVTVNVAEWIGHRLARYGA